MLLISIAENLKDFSATEARLLQNPKDIDNVFERFYGKNVAKAMMYEHLRLTSNEVEERLAGNYVADIKSFDEVQKEVLGMAQYFVYGIVCQFPDLF